MVVTLTENNFEQEVLKSERPVLVDFWAGWCAPCRKLSPVVDEVAAQASDVKIGKVNVDEENALAERYGVQSIPTLLLFRNGKVEKQSVGVISKQEMLGLLH